MECLERKLRVAMDWTLDLFFPRDIVLLKVFMKKTPSEIPADSSENLVKTLTPAESEHSGSD